MYSETGTYHTKFSEEYLENPETMFLMLDDDSFQHRPRLKKCGNFCTILSATVGFLILLTILAICVIDLTQKIHVVYIDTGAHRHTLDDKFLSIALDTSIIASGFKHFDPNNSKIIKMMRALSPAYLRVGGTMADRLTFSLSKSLHFKHLNRELDGGECSYNEKYCDYLQKPNFTMNAQEWLQLNDLAQKTGLQLIFDLNALKRFENGSWNYENAEKLISFSAGHRLRLNWELGNEPNAFRHQFNYAVAASQLARDFKILKDILRKHEIYKNSLLLGPDVTRPEPDKNASMLYLQEFLSGAGDVIDAVTWHQYYFNGATATVGDFLDPQYFDILQWQINIVNKIVSKQSLGKPIWLGETSSAYGGGAPHLSNRYVASFLWLDKLGTAAKNGLKVVVRQSIFQGHYALINDHYSPTPDWWVSILHKKLVGNRVVDCHFPHVEKLRLYCQCTNSKSYYENVPSVTVFGINLRNRRVKIRFEGTTPFNDESAMKTLKVQAYVLTTRDSIDSRFIYLNDQLLHLTETNDVPNLLPEIISANPYVEMPAYSLGFWVVPITGTVSSNC